MTGWAGQATATATAGVAAVCEVRKLAWLAGFRLACLDVKVGDGGDAEAVVDGAVGEYHIVRPPRVRRAQRPAEGRVSARHHLVDVLREALEDEVQRARGGAVCRERVSTESE